MALLRFCFLIAGFLLPLVAMLTYKSIAEAIEAHEGRRLYRLPPPDQVDGQRTMYVPGALLEELSVFDDSHVGRRHAALRDFLDGFSLGDHLTVSHHPHAKPGYVTLSRVDPPSAEVWSFRCLSPAQGMRVLGRFAARDCFIVLDWNYREVLDERDEWNNAIRRCQTAWRELFWRSVTTPTEPRA
jgi:hypothetical protein